MTAVQIVGPVGNNDRDARRQLAGEQEAKQIAGGRISPVHVFDEQQHGRALACQCKRTQHRLEQLLAGVGALPVAVVLRSHHPLAGQQPGQRRSVVQERLAEGRGVASNPAEDLGERHVGQGIARKVQAMADQDVPFIGPRQAGKLGEQSRLADPCVAAEQHRPSAACRTTAGPAARRSIAGESDEVRESVQLLGAANQAARLRRRIFAHGAILALTYDIPELIYPP
jgi:hypothetical protein